MSTLRILLSRFRTDAAVGLLAVLVLMTWPGEIFGFVLDLLGVGCK